MKSALPGCFHPIHESSIVLTFLKISSIGTGLKIMLMSSSPISFKSLRSSTCPHKNTIFILWFDSLNLLMYVFFVLLLHNEIQQKEIYLIPFF